jgi:membrane fusion protein (multidrug efflux system)
MRIRLLLPALLLGVAPLLATMPAAAQGAPGGPPAVGVVTVKKQPIVETSEFVGRIQAINKVDIIARVTAFVADRNFVEGAEVDQGALLYTLERGPFEADLQAKQAAVQQNAALLRNATITLGRAQALLNTPAGQRSTVDDAQANQASQAAQLLAAQAQLRQSQINLDYTEIRAPFAGKLAKSTVTVGNVVSPTSGPLTTIVSQDPMYVLFPVPLRAALDLRNHYADKGGFAGVVIKIKLPDGTMYPINGKLNYVDPSVSISTDTVDLRAVIANPVRPDAKPGDPANRYLIDGSFVTVLLEGVQPVEALAIPRTAVLSDQQGNYVYIVDADKKAQIRRIRMGQSTPETAVILAGLSEGETVISDGLQRVRPGAPVNAGPAAPAAPKG